MGITAYSLAISIVFYNLALIVVFILRRSPGFRARHAVSLLAFITVLGVVRLVLPIDFDAAYVVRSYKIIPAVEDFLRRPLAAHFAYGHLLLALWAVGSLVMVIKDVGLQRRFDRYLQNIDFVDRPELLEIAAEYGNDFAVLISPQLNMPFTSGILRPIIYLPDVELNNAEWRMVFRHEITHIRSRDNLKKLFFLAVEAIFWWNPLAHFSAAEINTLIELQCDAKVTASLSDQEKLNYIAALKSNMDYTSHSRYPIIAMSMIGSQNEMRLRFDALMVRREQRPVVQFYYPVSFFMLFVFSYFVIVQPAHIISKEAVEEYVNGHVSYEITEQMNDANPNEMFIVFRDGVYLWYMNSEYVCALAKEEVLENPFFNKLKIIQMGGLAHEENH